MDGPKFTMKCPQCGREFPPLSWNQKYCDDVCARHAYIQRRKTRRKPELLVKRLTVYDDEDNG